jgi:hypothetical protein
VSIDEDGGGCTVEARESPPHGKEGSLKDVDSVDLPGTGPSPTHILGSLEDPLQEDLALAGREKLGVTKPRDSDLGREDDGRSHNGAGQTAAPRFIDSDDGFET